MERLLFVLLLVLFILPCISCQSKNEYIAEDLLYVGTTSLYYKNMQFYNGLVDSEHPENLKDYTLKYINFDNYNGKAIPVYSDVFDEAADPFYDEYNLYDYMIVDEEATAENNGIPVLIIANSVQTDTNDYDVRFESFNMSNNKLKVLLDSAGGSILNMAVYKDTIYYCRFLGEMTGFEMKGEFGYYALPKGGGEPVRLPFPDETTAFSLKYAYNGKLYLQSDDLGKVYKCNPDFTEMEVVWKSDPESSPYVYYDGYVYYKSNFRTYEYEPGKEVKYFDYCRMPLDSITEKGSETVIENATLILRQCQHTDGKIYYNSFDDLQISPLKHQKTNSILRSYNLKSREKSVVYDFSDNADPRYTAYFCNDKYCIFYVSKHPELGNGKYLLNRDTGELQKMELQ